MYMPQVLNTQMEVVARRKMNEMRWERNSRKRSRGEQDDDDNDQKLYIGSEIFLKGTQSANPHNDYQQHFVDTGGNCNRRDHCTLIVVDLEITSGRYFFVGLLSSTIV